MAEPGTVQDTAPSGLDGHARPTQDERQLSTSARHSSTTSAGAAWGDKSLSRRPRDEVKDLSPEQHREMGSRGSLEVKDKAVERIAEAATLEVHGVAPAATTTSSLGNALGRSYPRVEVHVAGRKARAQVEIVTHWPHPAAQVAAAVREHVADRLKVLADLDVDAVQVEVAKVIRPTSPERKRVQ